MSLEQGFGRYNCTIRRSRDVLDERVDTQSVGHMGRLLTDTRAKLLEVDTIRLELPWLRYSPSTGDYLQGGETDWNIGRFAAGQVVRDREFQKPLLAHIGRCGVTALLGIVVG